MWALLLQEGTRELTSRKTVLFAASCRLHTILQVKTVAATEVQTSVAESLLH